MDDSQSAETKGSESANTTPGDSTPTPAASNQHDEQGHEAAPALMPDMPAGVGAKPEEGGAPGPLDDIQVLKRKILELERQARAGPEDRAQESSQPQPKPDLDEYERMMACLFKHRKESEGRLQPDGMWGIIDQFRRYYMCNSSPEWKMSWNYIPKGSYNRVNPFDPSHDCTGGQDEGNVGGDAYDDYEHTIEYGDRRDRLRKHFEWEMDRLWLDEEMDRRRKERIAEGQRQAADKNESGQRAAKAEVTPPPAYAEPRLNRCDWPPFKQLTRVAEKDASVVDVLMGEPIIDNSGDLMHWYGFPGRRARKLDSTQNSKAFASMAPGRPPLPERIRVHSAALLQILSTILEDQMSPSDDEPVVFLRPFKALVYCERALRDWCAALEKKFGAASGPETNVRAAADGSAAVPQKDRHAGASQEPKDDPGPISAGDGSESSKPAVDGSGVVMGEEPSEEQAGRGREDLEGQAVRERGQREQAGTENKPGNEALPKSITALQHLQCLLSFMDADISAKRAYLNSSECRKVFFSDLWHLFRPGMEVVGADGKQAYRVIEVTSARHRVVPAWQKWYHPPGKTSEKKPPFRITCVYIDFDGVHLGPVTRVFDFRSFDGERDITSLEVYPLRFHPVRRSDFGNSEWAEAQNLPAGERYRHKLRRRGARFLEAAAVKHMYYAGPTLEVRDEVESQVVIDFETAFSVEDEAQQLWKPSVETPIGNFPAEPGNRDADSGDDESCHAQCCLEECVYSDGYVDQKQRTEYVNSLLPEADSMSEQPSVAIIPRPLRELRTGPESIAVSEDELVIMSYRVFGFVLRSRKWAKLDLEYLSDAYSPDTPAAAGVENTPPENSLESTAFRRLVLEKWHGPMIVSLIAQHFRDKKSTTGQREEFDIVKGKGKGLILLLHGAPGVGKTSTAERVAEMFKKPLFQITCGDLGTTAAEVERALETNFALANRWDCILLLDEADVFLAERSKLDYKRNGLVAVFLRVMEYYAGILFLTTNRVGDFDEAFASRIHVSLYYPELNESKTVEVFSINMDMIEERFANKGRVIKIDRVGIGSFAAKHFAGYPHARWNGRQIRNACQTALALAEFEAQGSSHEAVLRPNAVVTLDLRHFEIVRNAYLEFTRYMDDLHGTNVARRAKESRLRAIWIDENDRVVATRGMGASVSDKQTAFVLESQGRILGTHQGQQPTLQQRQQNPPFQEQQQQQQQQGFPQAGMHVQHQQYPQYYNHPATQASSYPGAGYGQMPPQHFTGSQNWSHTSVGPSAPFQGPGERQAQTPGLQQQQQPNRQIRGR